MTAIAGPGTVAGPRMVNAVFAHFEAVGCRGSQRVGAGEAPATWPPIQVAATCSVASARIRVGFLREAFILDSSVEARNGG